MVQFGDPAISEQRLNFAQAFNPPGTIFGVALGTWFIFSGVEKTAAQVGAMKSEGSYAAYLHTEILRVVPLYVLLGVTVLLLAICIGRAHFPPHLTAIADDSLVHLKERSGDAYVRLFHNPRLMFAVGAQFFYVGAQVGTWSTLIPYLRAYTPVSEKTAGYRVVATLVALAWDGSYRLP